MTKINEYVFSKDKDTLCLYNREDRDYISAKESREYLAFDFGACHPDSGKTLYKNGIIDVYWFYNVWTIEYNLS